MSRAIRIVIGALGGEGGGVLGQWIADLADHEGYLSQTTSVPGVAQRTGATIYYIELFPRAEATQIGRMPVMSMFPTPGDVDIVICSEIVEAGRLIQRGFVTPERTTLISSTHRTYGITEKQAMGSGIINKESIVAVARERSKNFIGFDMLATASRFNAVINSALFGALAETGELPFPRAAFEETIRRGGIAVERNLETFAASFELAAAEQERPGVEIVDPAAPLFPTRFELPAGTTGEGRELLARVVPFPTDCHEMIYLGIKRLVQYQDYQYAHQYLDRLQEVRQLEPQDQHRLTMEVARFLALWMAFEDLPRVAQIKIGGQRFQRFREEVGAEADQQVAMVEFLHPRVEEFCGAMPAGLGQMMLNSKLGSGFLRLFAKPRNIRTNSVSGYLTLYLLAKLRRFRRASLVYQFEQRHIGEWLAAISSQAPINYELAVEIARCGRLIKGYGDTRERGLGNMTSILSALGHIAGSPAAVASLRQAALADDQGVAFSRTRAELVPHSAG